MDNESSISYSSAPITNNSNSNMFLKQANKNSHKIAKPIRKPLPNPTTTASSSSIPTFYPNPHNPGPGPGPGLDRVPPQSQQPAVYNINKNDFRDVVQKLTGSPAHERLQTPPPPPPQQVTQPRPPSSRLQRIRPPPLAQISNRPNQITQIHRPHPQNDAGQRPPPPHAQPFPPVHPAAESPISAYMRFLQNSASPLAPSPIWNGGPRPDSFLPQNEFGQRPPPPPLSPLHPAESPISAYMRFLQQSAASPAAPPPQWNGGAPFGGPRPDSLMPQNEFGQRPPPPFSPLHPVESPVSAYMRFLQNSGAAPPTPPPQQMPPLTPSGAFPSPFPAMPLSPLPFGCIPSPRSPYGMMSPGFLFSPMGQLGLPQLPLSPTLPVRSPRWKGM